MPPFIKVKDIKDLGGYVVDSADFPPVSVSLQQAYEAGNQINQSIIGNSIEVTGDNSATPLFNLIIDNVGVGVRCIVNNVDVILLRCESLVGGTTDLTANKLLFLNGFQNGYCSVESGSTGEGQASTLAIRGGQSDQPGIAGPVSIGFKTGAQAEAGGVYLDPATGVFQLRVYTVNGLETGSLQVHGPIDESQEAELPLVDGLIHLRTGEPGAERESGFRARNNGSYGLLGRGRQLEFTNADLVAGVLTYVHNLTTSAPIVNVYDNNGVQVPIELAAPLLTIRITYTDVNTVTVEFAAALLPLTGNWRITVMGF